MKIILRKLIYVRHHLVISQGPLLHHVDERGYVAAIDFEVHIHSKVKVLPFTCAPLIECCIILF